MVIFLFQSVGDILEELYVEVEGHKVHYLFNGVASSIPIVLLHGARYNVDTWIGTKTLEVLTLEGYSAYAIDLPGFGKSDQNQGINSTFDFSEFLFALLSVLELRKVALVGPSLSGVISLIFATKHPDQISGLVLIGSAGPEVEELKPQIELLNFPTLLVWGEKDVMAPMDMGREIQSLIKGSELFVIEGGSHACYLDDANSFNRKLIEFLGTFLKT